MKKALVASAVLGVLAAVHSSSAFAAGPTLHSNATPPTPRNPSAATGRAGSAKLTARALTGKDGKTVVDVTTGELDKPGAPGSISKIQFKGINQLGDDAWVKNFTGLTEGGALQFTFDDLQRGKPITAQANVRGIDGKRTDVVTVTETVKRRPDLAVTGLDAPADAPPGAHFTVTASINELNGDVGAKATCKLFVDGALDDEARDIWVDDHGNVACMFSVSIDSPGTHALRATVDGVTPSDWDTANNERSRTIEIHDPALPASWWADAASFRQYAYYKSAGGYKRIDGSYSEIYDWSHESLWDGHYEHSTFALQTLRGLRFPFAQVAASQRADGVTIAAVVFDDLQADYSWDSGYDRYEHAARYDEKSGSWLYIDVYDSADRGYGYSHVQHWRDAAAYMYFGKSAQSHWYGYAGETPYGYTWSYGSSTKDFHGTFQNAASYDFALTALDGAGAAVSAAGSVAMQPDGESHASPWVCSERSYTSGSSSYEERSCNEHSYGRKGTRGSASGTNQ